MPSPYDLVSDAIAALESGRGYGAAIDKLKEARAILADRGPGPDYAYYAAINVGDHGARIAVVARMVGDKSDIPDTGSLVGAILRAIPGASVEPRAPC